MSAILGGRPSSSYRKGDAIGGNASPTLAPTGGWVLDSTLSPELELEEHVEFILGQHDWLDWEAAYPGGGRPAYPPRAMVGLLIYGYSVGIRSSRALEHACRYSKDFIWLMSGRTPDHDTIANFRIARVSSSRI